MSGIEFQCLDSKKQKLKIIGASVLQPENISQNKFLTTLQDPENHHGP